MTKMQKTLMTILIIVVVSLLSERYLGKETVIITTADGSVTVTGDSLVIDIPADTLKVEVGDSIKVENTTPDSNKLVK